MSSWWYATDVDVTAGSEFVQVNSGDDLSFFEGQEFLQVRGYDAVEVKTRNTQTGVIELAKPWPYNTDSGRSAEAFPTAANLIETNRKLNRLIELYEGTFDGVLDNIAEVLTSTDATITIPTSEGDVQVVPYGYLKNQIDGLFQQFDTDLRRNRIFGLAGIVL